MDSSILRRVARVVALPALSTLILVSTPDGVRADDEGAIARTGSPDIGLEINGTFQPRLSYGRDAGVGDADATDRLGFGIRRARLMFTADFDGRVGIHYDVDLRGGNLDSVDLYAFYTPHESWRFRLGYIPGAQPRSYIPTSHTRIDGIDRAAIAERWSDVTIGGRGRDFGAEARYKTSLTRLELFVHKGDGNFDPSRGNFRQSIADVDATRGVDETALAVSTAFGFTPQGSDALEIGGFASYNAARGPYTALEDGAPGRSYGSWSAHVYYGPHPGDQPYRFKAEALGIHYESGSLADGTPVDARDTFGWAVFGAAAVVENSEVFARYEEYDADDGAGADAYWTFGASYSLGAARGADYREERLTLAYTNALPGTDAVADQHLVVMQWQWVY